MAVQLNPRKGKKGWIYRFMHQGREYKKEGFRTEEEATYAEIELKFQIRHPAAQGTIQITFSQGYNRYIERHCKKRFGKNTWRQKAFIARALVKFLGRDPILSSISQGDVEEFLLNRLDANGFANAESNTLSADEKFFLERHSYLVRRKGSDPKKVANRTLRDLRAFYKWAIKKRLTTHSPCDGVERYGEDERRRYIPPAEDFLAVVQVANGFELDLIQTVMHTLGRLSEVLQLRIEDVNLNDRTVELETRKRDGGGSRRNKIVMSEPLFQCLQRRTQDLPDGTEYVFPHTNPVFKHYGRHHLAIKDMLDVLCAKAGVKRFTFYAFRHYGAIVLADSGAVTLREIQHMMRHERITTTADYLRSMKPNLKNAAAVLGKHMPAKKVEH
jgi:integrase